MTTHSESFYCLITSTHGNVAQHVVGCSAIHAEVPQEVAEVSGVVDSFDAHADPVHPVDVKLGLYPANGQVKVVSGRYGAAETHD